jgi:hypothetical protein
VQRQQETITRILASYRPLPVPTARELHETEMELRTRLPQTPEDVDEVEKAVAEIGADPEQLSLIGRMTSGISREDISELTACAVLVLAAWLFFNVANLPLTEVLSPVQDAVLSNDTGVVSIIVSVALYIRRRG